KFALILLLAVPGACSRNVCGPVSAKGTPLAGGAGGSIPTPSGAVSRVAYTFGVPVSATANMKAISLVLSEDHPPSPGEVVDTCRALRFSVSSTVLDCPSPREMKSKDIFFDGRAFVPSELASRNITPVENCSCSCSATSAVAGTELYR